MELNKIILSDWVNGLKSLPDNSIDCVVTSPPYWNLRDYGIKGQLGLETTPEEYINKLIDGFREVKRVLKESGTLWLNIGDSYVGGKGSSGQGSSKYQAERAERGESINKHYHNIGGKGITRGSDNMKVMREIGLKPKDLVGIPWMLAFALRADGWYLRQDIIWHKPNPMPESVTDRCTKSHEYIFLLSKSPKYYFNQESILQKCSDNTHARISQDLIKQIGSIRANGGKKTNGNMKAVVRSKKTLVNEFNVKNNESFNNSVVLPVTMANKRSVWTVTTKPFKESHFATFPQELIVDCIKAGCPENGIVLDPFMGAGTTAIVARKLNRNYIGFEINPLYVKMAERRIFIELGMFK